MLPREFLLLEGWVQGGREEVGTVRFPKRDGTRRSRVQRSIRKEIGSVGKGTGPGYVSETDGGVDMAVACPAAVRCRRKGEEKSTWKVCGGWMGTCQNGGQVMCIAHAAGIVEPSQDGNEGVEWEVRKEGKHHSWMGAKLVEIKPIGPIIQELEKCRRNRSISERMQWEFGWKTSVRTNGNLRQVFRVAILQVLWNQQESIPATFAQQLSCEGSPGTPFTVRCTPFDASSPLFSESHLVGIVSNTWHAQNDTILYMLDLKALPGIEGSLMLDEKCQAMGMLMLPVQKKGSQFELPLAAPTRILATALPELFEGSTISHNLITQKNASHTIFSLLDSIVLISGPTFASGIVLGEGWILSSAHAFPDINGASQPEQAIQVRVQKTDSLGRPHFSWHKGILFWKSVPSLDAALLKLLNPPRHLKGLSCLQKDDYQIGKHVWIIGHAHPQSTLNLPSSIYGGTISSVEKDADGLPTVVQTTANVHPGCSGGALVDSNGDFIALVAGNSVHKTGHTLPHLNFCVPFSMLRSIVSAALSGIEDDQKMNQLLKAQQKWAQYPSVLDLGRRKSAENQLERERDLPPALARFLRNNKFQLQSKL